MNRREASVNSVPGDESGNLAMNRRSTFAKSVRSKIFPFEEFMYIRRIAGSGQHLAKLKFRKIRGISPDIVSSDLHDMIRI